MQWSDFERHFSVPRTERYRLACRGNESSAAKNYAFNLKLAAATMPLLHTLEIALRNGIQTRLAEMYQRQDWWIAWKDNPVFSWQNREIATTVVKIKRRSECSPDKVIAELTFGFWTSLFNQQQQAELWKDLRLIFARCPKHLRQRHHVAAALNQVRNLRNRVFHHEPLLWLSPCMTEQHNIGLTLLRWIDPVLVSWLNDLDHFKKRWGKECHLIN